MPPALSSGRLKVPRPTAKVVGHYPANYPACALGGGAEKRLPPTFPLLADTSVTRYHFAFRAAAAVAVAADAMRQ